VRGHAGQRPDWARWPTVEGGYLVDRRALREAAEAAGVGPPSGPEEAAIRGALIALLERGVERCPHGLPLGVDLALPDGCAPWQLDLLAGPAMGSGRMPWTRALLAALERHVAPGSRIADVGTGTGILGLVALRLGGAHVDAVDVDPLAVAIARRNARANRLADRFRARAGSVDRLGRGYDLAIVSLGTSAELPRVVGETVRRLCPGGVLVASPAEGADERAALLALLDRERLAVVEEVAVDAWTVAVGRAPT